MRKFWVQLDVKGQVKVHFVNGITHRSHPWCSGGVLFPTLGKKKGYIEVFCPETSNSTKTAAFICVSECIDAHTNQPHLISFDKKKKIRQKLSYR